jgi:hypothetical protein
MFHFTWWGLLLVVLAAFYWGVLVEWLSERCWSSSLMTKFTSGIVGMFESKDDWVVEMLRNKVQWQDQELFKLRLQRARPEPVPRWVREVEITAAHLAESNTNNDGDGDSDCVE